MDNQKLIALLEQALEIARSAIVSETTTVAVSAPPPTEDAALALLKSEEWPEAVPQFLICEDNELDKKERAEGILDFMDVSNVTGKKFLDFGCGEGHVAVQAAGVASKSIGYDIIPSGVLSWEGEGDSFLTTDFNKVLANGPYDFISLHDVLDHAQNPVDVLNQVKSVCSPDTKVFVRFHPWIGRHASHLYRQINKAWIHVFFTEEEIQAMGYKMEYVNKTYFPMASQKKWFDDAGFKVLSTDVTKTAVEPFFRRPELKSRIPNQFKEFPEWQMCQAFNDYVIKTS